MVEYWLQKKTIGGWSHVTSYTELEQATRNYANCVGNGLSGYCWRLVEVKELEVAMLQEVVEIDKDTELPTGLVGQSITIKNVSDKPVSVKLPSGWGNLNQDAPKSTGWGSGWAEPKSKASDDPILNTAPSSHGLSGSVWVIHHQLRQKSRVPSSELDSYLNKGYVRGGPRTQFEG